MFWLTVATVVVAAASAGISYLLFRSQVEPEVIVFADAAEAPGLLSLVIQNIGKGVAKGITFSCSEPIPEGLVANRKVIETGPLIRGIPALGPGAKRVVLWGDADTLIGMLGHRVIRIRATYESDNRWPWSGGTLVTESVVEVGSFMHTAVPRNHDERAAESLADIARTLGDAVRRLRLPGAG